MHVSLNLWIDGLVQDCSNSSAELLQFYTKPPEWYQLALTS